MRRHCADEFLQANNFGQSSSSATSSGSNAGPWFGDGSSAGWTGNWPGTHNKTNNTRIGLLAHGHSNQDGMGPLVVALVGGVGPIRTGARTT